MLWIHFKTIFSFAFYHRLPQVPRKLQAGFLAYLFLLSVLVFWIYSGQVIRKNLPPFLRSFPQVTFEKGILTAPDKAVYVYVPGTDMKIGFDASRQTPPGHSEMLQQKLLLLVGAHAMYMPGSSTVDERTIPAGLSVVTTPEFLAGQQSALGRLLRTAALILSLLVIPFIMLGGLCLALFVGLFFSLITRRFVPLGTLWCWAVFLQGPLAVLWYLWLWVDIPLFTTAQLILCIIYIQQIFNLLAENAHEN